MEKTLQIGFLGVVGIVAILVGIEGAVNYYDGNTETLKFELAPLSHLGIASIAAGGGYGIYKTKKLMESVKH